MISNVLASRCCDNKNMCVVRYRLVSFGFFTV